MGQAAIAQVPLFIAAYVVEFTTKLAAGNMALKMIFLKLLQPSLFIIDTLTILSSNST